MAEAVVDGSPMSRFFCHKCSIEIERLLPVSTPRHSPSLSAVCPRRVTRNRPGGTSPGSVTSCHVRKFRLSFPPLPSTNEAFLFLPRQTAKQMTSLVTFPTALWFSEISTAITRNQTCLRPFMPLEWISPSLGNATHVLAIVVPQLNSVDRGTSCFDRTTPNEYIRLRPRVWSSCLINSTALRLLELLSA